MDKKEEKKEKLAEGKKPSFKLPKKFLGRILVLAILVILIVKVFVPKVFRSKPGEVSTITKSSLEKVIEINDLETLDYTYNAVTDVRDEEDRLKYHVAYDGVVTAGIDFSNIDIAIDEEAKKISIKVPKASILDLRVDTGTMDYIFEKRRYETESVSHEAYKACLEDLKNRAEKEESLLEMADENALSTVRALIEPWVKEVDQAYEVEVVSDEK